MHIRIITSCTGKKRFDPDGKLTSTDFMAASSSEMFRAREMALADYRLPAGEMYTGQQHLRLMNGIRQFRSCRPEDKIDLWIVSASYGIVAEDQQIVPYNHTFQGMKVDKIKEQAECLDIPNRFMALVKQPADLCFVLLGEDYLRALSLYDLTSFKAPTLFFTSRNALKYVRGKGTLYRIPLGNADARRFSCALFGLKGELAKRLLDKLIESGPGILSNLTMSAADILNLANSAGCPSITDSYD